MNSLVIPVYRNEANLDRLLAELVKLGASLAGDLEVVFVVDGSPDRCLQILREKLPSLPLRTQLISLSRNFGSFAAIAAGLDTARGSNLAVMAADLRSRRNSSSSFSKSSPPAAPISFSECAADARTRGFPNSHPTCSGSSTANSWSRTYPAAASTFSDAPARCATACSASGCRFQPHRPPLLARLPARIIVYERRRRLEGKSAWTLRKKLRYCLNSIFNFTDLPIQLLLWAGALALCSRSLPVFWSS